MRYTYLREWTNGTTDTLNRGEAKKLFDRFMLGQGMATYEHLAAKGKPQRIKMGPYYSLVIEIKKDKEPTDD